MNTIYYSRPLVCIISLFFLTFIMSACGSSGEGGIFSQPTLIAVDSANDRLFVLENDGKLLALTASEREKITDDPLVDDENAVDIQDTLPQVPLDMKVAANGSASRLFIAGAHENADGDTVFNEIIVLDFDGTDISESSISPIILDDGDSTTEEADNIPGGMAVDPDNSRLFVTDATEGTLYTFSTSNGSQPVAPLAIAGSPNTLSLDSGRLYVANASATEEEQLISVVNTEDFSVTTISAGIPISDIAAISNDSGTVLLARQSTDQLIMVREVDTSTFASLSSIPVSDDSAEDGQMSNGNGITSSSGRLILSKNSSGDIYGYAPQVDGNIKKINFSDDLSSFNVSNLSTATLLPNGIDLYQDSDGNGLTVYIAATGSGDLVFTDVGSDEVGARF